MANNVNLTIRLGATWTIRVGLRDADCNVVNLDDYDAQMQMRNGVGLIATLTTSGGSPAITHDGGDLVLTLTAAQTLALTTTLTDGSGAANYDLLIKNTDGVVKVLLQGVVSFKPLVTIWGA